MFKTVMVISLYGFLAHDIYIKNKSRALRTLIITLYVLLVVSILLLLIKEILVVEIANIVISVIFIYLCLRRRRTKAINK